MKIALLTNGMYPFNMGGMQKHSYYLARYLAKKKIYVDVYHFELPDKNRKEKTDNFFKQEELNYIRFFSFRFPRSLYFPGHYVFNSYRYSCKIYDHLKPKISEVDFVYVQGFTGWKLLKEKKIGVDIPPVGVNFHGLEMFQKTANTRSKIEQYLFRPPVNFCLQNADVAFSLGGRLTDILKEQVGETTRIWETPIGLEEKWINKETIETKGCRKFVFIGRYERRKGIEELNEAIKELDNKYAFDFEFIGPIPKIKQLNLSNCHYHGPIYDEDKIIRIISKNDVLVCPSYSEGMPTVILEAMSRGLSVIATDVGAVSELVSSKTGWLIEPANQPELERALTNAIKISDTNLQLKKEAALKRITDSFTWDTVINSTVNQINKMLLHS